MILLTENLILRRELTCLAKQAPDRGIDSRKMPFEDTSVADITKPTLNLLSRALGSVSLMDPSPTIAHLTALFCWGSGTSRQP